MPNIMIIIVVTLANIPHLLIKKMTKYNNNGNNKYHKKTVGWQWKIIRRDKQHNQTEKEKRDMALVNNGRPLSSKLC